MFSMTQKERIQVKWEGPALQDKLIDVRDLAPSLIALGDLCVAANKSINGDKSEVKVMISAEPDQSSFVIDIYFYLEAIEAARTLLGAGFGAASTLKEILEWIDLLAPYVKKGGGLLVGGGGLIGLYKLLNGKEVIGEPTRSEIEGSPGAVNLTIGNNTGTQNISVHPTVFMLAQDPAVVDALNRFVEPIAADNGIESVSFIAPNRETRKLARGDVDLNTLCGPIYDESDDTDETTVNTVDKWCKLISPVFDENAEKWRFEISGVRHYVDISDTEIALQAEARGGVGFEDMYKLRLVETDITNARGKSKVTYKAVEQLDFKGTAKQGSFL